MTNNLPGPKIMVGMKSKSSISYGNKISNVIVNQLMNTICSLVVAIEKTDDTPTGFQFPEDEKAYLMDKLLWTRFIRDNVNSEVIKKMVCHLSWKSKKFSKLIIFLIKDGLLNEEPSMFSNYFSLLQSLLDLNDSIQDWRVDVAMCSHLPVIEANISRKACIDTYVKLLQILGSNQKVKYWCMKYREPLNSLLSQSGWEIQ